jgi:hypothetical protein
MPFKTGQKIQQEEWHEIKSWIQTRAGRKRQWYVDRIAEDWGYDDETVEKHIERWIRLKIIKFNEKGLLEWIGGEEEEIGTGETLDLG